MKKYILLVTFLAGLFISGSAQSDKEDVRIAIAGHILKNNQQLDELHSAYFTKFRKAVGGTKAATLLQLELYIQTALEFRLQNEIPVIGELRKAERQ